MGDALEHDAARQVGYIQQALSQNKRPTGFFIGAGCPLSIRNPDHTPLIPDVAGLTQKIAEAFATAPNKADWETLIKAVGEDGGDGGNVEHILSNIRQLAAVAGKSSVRGLTRDSLDKLVLLSAKVLRYHLTNRQLHFLRRKVFGLTQRVGFNVTSISHNHLLIRPSVERTADNITLPFSGPHSGENRVSNAISCPR